MTRRRPFSPLLWILLVGAAATAAASLNLLLLGRASGGNHPVGRLNARASIPAAPHWTIRSVDGRPEGRALDD